MSPAAPSPASGPLSIHLIGVCGTGMGSFAGLLKAAGHHVRGSDANVYPPMSDKLRDWGIPVARGYRPENLEPEPDLVIVGNVIRRDNPEAAAVRERGLEQVSFPEALSRLFLTDRRSLVVAGTHGKTTTTSLLAWLLTDAGQDPGLLVGGVPGNFGEGFRHGRGPCFVVEGDEYDTAYFDKRPKFLHYRPRVAVLTSIEFDHADIYDGVEAIERRFDELVALVPAPDHGGRILACASFPRVMARRDRAPRPEAWQTYSARPEVEARWRAERVVAEDGGQTFDLLDGPSNRGRFHLPMTGRHNLENAVAALAVALQEGVPVATLQSSLPRFEGVARRQTVRAVVDDVTLIDDFAHHPTAVQRTLEGLAEQRRGRLLAVFEPRTATSSRAFFQDAYARSFGAADRVYLAPVGRTELAAEERLDVARLAEEISAEGPPATAFDTIAAIVEALDAETRPGDVVVFMSNGAFGGIHDDVEARLQARIEAPGDSVDR